MKLAVIAGETRPDDYVIRRDGVDVGRIHPEIMPAGMGRMWFWASWVHPARHGYADSMEEAREAVRSAVIEAEESFGR